MRVGFGDDVAAAAGLVCRWDGAPVPAGDAIADPLTGVVAAAAAWRALGDERGCLLDVSMAAVAADAVRRQVAGTSEVAHIGDSWEVRTGSDRSPVRPPTARQPSGPARALGIDTAAVLQEFDLIG
jgi:crotonobetainyl-CoA:carnitine CoA-transferase CaiB-like acyl-CoA transferase